MTLLKLPPNRVSSLRERLLSRVAVVGECWVFTGTRNPRGYGCSPVKIDGVRHSLNSHRLSWLANRGSIPAGMCVCHHCDNPSCVRPSHLFLGTQKDNMRDMARKGRRKSSSPGGERSGHATLTDNQVRQIARECGSGLSQASVARQFRISPNGVCSIMRGRSWNCVTGFPRTRKRVVTTQPAAKGGAKL